MKKLLYTLFAFALIVACEKDMDDKPSYSVSPIEASVEELDLSAVKDILNDIGFTSELQNMPLPKGYDSNLTARTSGESTAANCFDNRPDVPAGKTAFDIQYLPIDSSEGYLFLRGGGDIPLALNRPIVRFLIGGANEPIQLQLFLFVNGSFGSAIPLGPTPYNFGLTFIAADGVISIDRTNLYLDSVTPSVTETSDDAGVTCGASTPVTSHYTVTPAPFPLSGFLATIISGEEANFTGSSANYAGTTEAAVRAAIEADIMDGN